MPLGAHMSIAGGIDRAAERGRAAGCEAIQIFTRNSNRWEARPVEGEEIERFRRSLDGNGIRAVVAHASYLINLGSPDPALRERSVRALAAELDRCDRLGIPHLVLHPGAHMGTGEEAGLERVRTALERVVGARPPGGAEVCLETTAGQGTCLGHRFEHFRHLIEHSAVAGRLGFCLDTCHLLAAGYDLRTRNGYRSVMGRFDRLVGLDRVRVIHLNDAKRGLGSRVDRHEHIGRGCVGVEAFRCLLRDRRFAGVPKLLETPKGKDGTAADRRNLAVLRRLGACPSIGLGRVACAAGPDARKRDPGQCSDRLLGRGGNGT
ncbi:MAG: deoxyribonuclease IV [Acidobacteria bacterium]|nr:deoxyribonuclease IV [Acidobacteriota bacterium]